MQTDQGSQQVVPPPQPYTNEPQRVEITLLHSQPKVWQNALMPNALHRKDGSEQNLTNQDRRAKCLNFNVSKEKFQKDEVSPSLEQQTKNSFKVSIIPQKKDEDKLLQNINKQRADDL